MSSTCTLSFLFLRFGGITLLVIYRRSVFLWTGRGVSPIKCGTLVGIYHLHTWTTLLHRFTVCVRVFTRFSPTLSLHHKTRSLTLSFHFFISSSLRKVQYIAFPNARERGE